MTPGTTTLSFYRGARWAKTFTVKQTGTDDPIDLSGYGPFVMEIRRRKEGALLLAPTYVEIDLVNGQIAFEADAAGTDALPQPPGVIKPLTAYFGIRDNNNNLYVTGAALIYDAIPAPEESP